MHPVQRQMRWRTLLAPGHPTNHSWGITTNHTMMHRQSTACRNINRKGSICISIPFPTSASAQGKIAQLMPSAQVIMYLGLGPTEDEVKMHSERVRSGTGIKSDSVPRCCCLLSQRGLPFTLILAWVCFTRAVLPGQDTRAYVVC